MKSVENRSVREILENERIIHLATKIGEDMQRTDLDDVDVHMTKRQRYEYTTIPFRNGSRKQFMEVAHAWNVSLPTLIRLCMHKVMVEYGFPASEVLMNRDVHSTGRRGRLTRKPFTSRSEASLKSADSWSMPERVA